MGVDKVVSLSTDKASSPANLYGATKLTADKLIIAGNYHKGSASTKFSVVRYGNVFGSRGSIVPHLLNLKKNSIFTITDTNMTRFTITINEGINFVTKCLKDMLGGEIFIPKINSYRLIDLVSAHSRTIKTKVIGIRPGEKIHEEMISINDAINTVEYKNGYVICPSSEFMQWDIEKYKKKIKGKSCAKNFTYTSDKNKFLTINDLKKVLKNNIDDFELN